ncbi:MAG: SDR family oxidoreductase [Myxococcales bacterium]
MRQAVAITGISGNLGRVVAKRLHLEDRIIGIDRRPFPGRPKDIQLHALDLRKKKCEDVFRKRNIRALVHMGFLHGPRTSSSEHHAFNLLGTTNVLEYCVRYGVKKVVVVSSANVYGPSPDNSNFLTEDAPLMAAARFPAIRDLVAADMYAQSFFYKHPDIETVILRPVLIVGPTIKNAPSNYLRLRRPWTLMGFDPVLQLVHAEDVARAIQQVLEPGIRGVYNVVGPGEVPLSFALKELGRSPIPVPHVIARPLVDTLFKYKLVEFPAAELDFLQYLCAVDGSRANREWGWKPKVSLRDTIRSVLGD